MADFSQTFTRPLATVTGTETSPLTLSLTADGTNKQWILDLHITISATEKTVQRFKLRPVYSGTTMTMELTQFLFTGSATYVSSTNPADSTATNAGGQLFQLLSQDFDAVHTAAGDARS